MIDDGVNGLLVPYGDVPALSQAVYRLLTDMDLNRIMGQKGYEKIAEKYNWNHVVERTMNNYQKCLAYFSQSID